ncbi:MAG: DNA-deoxyinosine glycosylase [Candidatus Omnitrophica bacterium]|nr:DNA-deoxyinosine glycosylase [Candidatus Omnitrophota bacterium]
MGKHGQSVGLAPLVQPDCTVLILGSMPSQKSLERQQYYGNPVNQFWKIIAAVYEISLTKDYARDVKLLQKCGIGLWDVIASCRRAGSLDANINTVKNNDISAFLLQYNKIKKIGCNGGLAYQLLSRHLNADIPVVNLPSSSPAHTVGIDNKICAWRQLLRGAGEMQIPL